MKYGKRKTFHLGSNLSCRQHICLHYKLYQQRCTERNIAENNHAIPQEVLEERRQQQVRIGLKQGDPEAQRQASLDGVFAKAPGLREFSREDMLKSVAEFIVCDNQVG